MQHLARQPHRGRPIDGTFRGVTDDVGHLVISRRRVQEVEWHSVPDRLVGGPVHRLQARLGPVDADHQGNRHRPCLLSGRPASGPLPCGCTCAAEGIAVLLE